MKHLIAFLLVLLATPFTFFHNDAFRSPLRAWRITAREGLEGLFLISGMEIRRYWEYRDILTKWGFFR